MTNEQQEKEQQGPPAWALPVIVCVRENAEWLLQTLVLVAEEAAPGGALEDTTTQARVVAIREIVGRVRVPWEARNAAHYAAEVLALLHSPQMVLFAAGEVQAIVQYVVEHARAACAVMSDQLADFAADTTEVTL